MDRNKYYETHCSDGYTRRVYVDRFKEATETYIREAITDYIIITQRIYQNGDWTIEIRTLWGPNIPYYRKKYKFSWLEEDIKGPLDRLILEYKLWKDTEK